MTTAPSTRTRLLALTVLALLLRMFALGSKGLWQDEVFSVLFARPSNPDFWPILKTAEANMALYYIALRQWMHFFTTDSGVRALSVIPGVLTVPAIYALGARLYSRRSGFWAAALLTVNACAVVYSQEARGYSLLVLFVALSYWAFLRVIERPSPFHVALYVAVTICAFYSHFYAIFVILAQVCSLAVLPAHQRPWKGLLTSWLIIAIAAIPGLRVVLLSHGSNLWWLPRPGLLEIYRTLTFLAAENGKAVGGILAGLLLVPIGFAICNAWTVWRSQHQSQVAFQAAFAALAFLVPLVATMLLSLWRPMFFHRFLIICLVPFLLLAAAGLDHLRHRKSAIALALLILALSGVATAMSYRKVREDWRGAAAFTLTAPDAPVLFYIKDAAAPFSYYRERLGRPLNPDQVIRLEAPPSSNDLATWATQFPHLWLVTFPTNDQRVTHAIESQYHLCSQAQVKAVTITEWSKSSCKPIPL